MLHALEQHPEAAQGGIDFIVAGQMVRVRRTELSGRFTFGVSVVGDAVFGHQFGGLMRQLFAHKIASVGSFFCHLVSEQLILDDVGLGCGLTRIRRGLAGGYIFLVKIFHTRAAIIQLPGLIDACRDYAIRYGVSGLRYIF